MKSNHDLIVDFDLFEDTLSTRNVYEPFNLKDTLRLVEETIQDTQLSGYAKQKVLASYINANVSATILSPETAAIINDAFKQLIESAVPLKESNMTLVQKEQYLARYLVTTTSPNNNPSAKKKSKLSLEDALDQANVSLVTGVDLKEATNAYYDKDDRTIFDKSFYLYDQTSDRNDRQSYTYVGNSLYGILLKIEEDGILNHPVIQETTAIAHNRQHIDLLQYGKDC